MAVLVATNVGKLTGSVFFNISLDLKPSYVNKKTEVVVYVNRIVLHFPLRCFHYSKDRFLFFCDATYNYEMVSHML